MASWGGAASTPIDLISLIAAVPLTIGAMAAETLLNRHGNLISPMAVAKQVFRGGTD
jgi:hypothetical protein